MPKPRLDRPQFLRERVPQTTLLAVMEDWEAREDLEEDPYDLGFGCRQVPPAPHAE